MLKEISCFLFVTLPLMILFKNKSSNKPQEIYKISPSVEVSNVGPTGLTDKLLDGFKIF